MVSDVHQNMHDTVLEKKLKPVLPARTSVGHHCLQGTRKELLTHIMDWAKGVHSSSKVYHLHGIAGSGKSSMASTICESLEAKKILAAARKEKLPLVDEEGNLKGLITIKDIEKQIKYPLSAKDSQGRLLCAAAVGITKNIMDRVDALIKAKVDAIVIDSAHGHSANIIRAVKIYKQ